MILSDKTKDELVKVSDEALNKLIVSRAFFRKKDLLKELENGFKNNLVLSGLDSSLKIELIEKLMKSYLLVPLFPNQKETEWSQFTTAQTIKMEREIVEMAKSTSDRHQVKNNTLIMNQLVEQAFSNRPTMADEQKEVVKASCLTDKNVIITEGTAGAGKSFSLNAIREVYENMPPLNEGEQPGYDIIGTAISRNATKVLEESAGLKGGMAIEGFVRKMQEAEKEGREFFKRRTLIIIDEAGLAPTERLHKIFHYALISRFPVRIILTGDSLQLNPVQAGNAMELLVDECGSTRLDTIRRQKQESHRNAVKQFCFGKAEKGLYVYYQQEAINFMQNKETLMDKVVNDYISYTSNYPEKTALVLALKNKDIDFLNKKIHDTLKLTGRVEEEGVVIKAFNGNRVDNFEFCIGDQIVFRQNDQKKPLLSSQFKESYKALEAIKKKENEKKTIWGWVKNTLFDFGESQDEIGKGVFNRTIGTIIGIKPFEDKFYEFRILLSDGGEVYINNKDYVHPDHHVIPMAHNFATTIYASQGQTVKRVFMIDDPYMNRRLAYVGASRHTELMDVYLDCEELNDRIIKRVSKEKEKALNKINRERYKQGSSPLLEIDHLNADNAFPNYSKDHQFSKKEYLAAVILAWNSPSLNQTVTMARKIKPNRPKKDLCWKSPLSNIFQTVESSGYSIEDHPEERYDYIQSPTFQQESVEAVKFLGIKVKDEHQITKVKINSPVKNTLNINQLNIDLEGVSDDMLSKTKGILWDFNRYGELRIFGYNPYKEDEPICKYDIEGNCVVGDKEPPIFLNKQATEHTPTILVQSFRELVIAYTYYRDKYKELEYSIPNIVVCLKDSKMDKVKDWLESQSVFVTHGKRDGSLQKALELSELLNQLQIKNELRPKVENRSKPKIQY